MVCRGLHYLRNRRVLHRDIKPGNILLHNEEVWIADLGLAMALPPGRNAVSNTELQPGTPPYMAPEMCSEVPYSFPVDIFAYGCTFHEVTAAAVAEHL